MAKRKKGKVRLKVGDVVDWHDNGVITRDLKLLEIKSHADGAMAVCAFGTTVQLTVPIRELRLAKEVA